MASGFFSLLAQRSFLYLWLAQLITQIGSNMLIFVLALHVFSASHSNTAVGLLFLAFGLPNFLFGAPAGVWVDRIGAKKALLISNFGRTLLLIIFYFARGNLILTYFLAFLFSLLNQLFLPAGGVLLPNLVKERHLLAANSFFSFTFYASLILGFSAAGPFLKVFREGVYFLFAFFFLLSTYWVTFLPPHLDLRQRIRGALRQIFSGHYPWRLKMGRGNLVDLWDLGSLLKEVLVGLNFIRHREKILRTFAFLAAAQVSLGVLVSLAPGFATSVLHLDLEDSSLYLILPAALGMILGAALLAHGFLAKQKDRLPFYGLLLIGLILVLLYPLTAFSLPLLLTGVLLLFLGVGNALVDVPSQTVLQEEVQDQLRGKVYGILGSFITAGATVPVLLATALADHFGVGKVLLSVGFVLLVVSFSLGKVSSVDR